MFYVDDENVGHYPDYFVLSTDTDCFYRAKPAFFFGLNQELGGLHAAEKGCALKKIYDEEKKTWMILRTRMEIHSLPKWTDTLEGITWCQEGYKLYGPRFIEIRNKTTGEKVFESGSYWVIMDLERKRPCKPNIFQDRLPFADKEKHWKDPVFPLFPSFDEFSGEKIEEKPVLINYYDTDYNRHVNNISYVNWTLDALSHDFLDSYYPTLIDVKWEKQSYLEDNLIVKTHAKENHGFNSDKPVLLSQVIRKNKDQEEEVFSALSEWTKRGKNQK